MAVPAPEFFACKVVELLFPAAGIKVFRLKPADNRKLSFKPGQWASLSLLGPDGKPADSRPYSISSSPDADYVEFCIRMQGRFPEKLAAVKVGDSLGVRGAFGNFFLNETLDNFTFIAGGVGLTPLLSAVRWLSAHKPTAKRTLVYSCRTPAELLFREELETMTRSDPNFKLIITITRPEPGMQWKGKTGRINEQLLREQTDLTSTFYFCGPPAFTSAMHEFLSQLGIPKERALSETW